MDDIALGSIALWSITTLAIASAAVDIARAKFVPLPARAALGLLAIYAIAAMGLALREGTPYVAWLDGESVYSGLQRWLRGGFVGVFLVVPIAIVVHALRIGVRRWREHDSVYREASRGLALTLCVAIAGAQVPIVNRDSPSSARAVASQASSTGSITLPPLSLPDPSPLHPVEFLTRADEMAARVARVDWDVDAKADSLADGVEPAFAFVRDGVRYEAYSGVLRGAAGTYVSRAGNTADRALLLARLLARRQVPTRFAIGTLPKADCERLLQRVFVADAMATRVADRLAALPPGGRTFQERIIARAKRDYDVVRQALGDRLPAVTKPSREDVLAEMNPHVWVQALVDARWIDLDPSFADSVVGKTSAMLDQTVAEVPQDLFQRVRVRLYAEHLSNGSLVPSTLLDVTRRTVDLLGAQIFLVHSAADPGNPMGGLGAAIGRALGRGDTSWTPLLSIDGDFTVGTPIRLSDSGPAFVAEWLEFEVSWPDGRREVTRRPLVDRAGAPWRATQPLDGSGLRPLETNDEGACAMQALHNIWFSSGRHNLVDFTRGMQYVVATSVLQLSATSTSEAGSPNVVTPNPDPASNMPEADFPENAFPFALHNLAWMVWTDHVVIPSLNATPGQRLYADGPRIAVFTAAPDSEDGFISVSDLRRDDLRALVADSSQVRAIAEKKLWFGMLQGSLEHEGLAELVAAAGGNPALVETTSSGLSSQGIVVLAPGISPPASTHAESVARLSTTLAAGNLVAAPRAGLDAGGAWWEIAAETGDTRAVVETGLNGGRGGFRPPNPIRTRVTPQTNSYAGPRVYEIDPETLSSIRRDAGRTSGRAQSVVRSQRGGGKEYSALVILVGLASFAAKVWVGYIVAVSVYSVTEQIVALLTSA